MFDCRKSIEWRVPMAMITNDWLDAVKPEFSKEYYKDLFCFVKDEYSKCVVYPLSLIHI